ncbi:hypothetical protein J6590_012858, partial [Homalodisca vitripennis]
DELSEEDFTGDMRIRGMFVEDCEDNSTNRKVHCKGKERTHHRHDFGQRKCPVNKKL